MPDDTLETLKATPEWAAAKKRYWDHLKKMLNFFQAQ